MLKDQILNHIKASGGIQDLLTVYNGEAAIFYETMPSQEDPKWSSTPFPSIVFQIREQGESERKSNGCIEFQIISNDEEALKLYNIESLLIQRVHKTFFVENANSIACPVWKRTRQEKGLPPGLLCRNLSFENIVLENNGNTLPDPVAAIQNWIKELYPRTKILFVDRFQDAFKITEDPILFWRLASIETAENPGYAATWYDSFIEGMILADSEAIRVQLGKAIVEELGFAKELDMPDESGFRIKKAEYVQTTNWLTESSIKISGSFGILNKPKEDPLTHLLKHAYMDG